MLWHLFELRLTKEGRDPATGRYYGMGAKVFHARADLDPESPRILEVPEDQWGASTSGRRAWAKAYIRQNIDLSASFYR